MKIGNLPKRCAGKTLSSSAALRAVLSRVSLWLVVLTMCTQCIHLLYMTTINVRIEDKTKKAASKALASMGLDLSTGVKLFLHQVVTEQGLPFTPTKNPAALRAKWDKEVAEALKKGKVYKNPRELFKDLGL